MPPTQPPLLITVCACRVYVTRIIVLSIKTIQCHFVCYRLSLSTDRQLLSAESRRATLRCPHRARVPNNSNIRPSSVSTGLFFVFSIFFFFVFPFRGGGPTVAAITRLYGTPRWRTSRECRPESARAYSERFMNRSATFAPRVVSSRVFRTADGRHLVVWKRTRKCLTY